MSAEHGAHVEPDYIKIFWYLFGLTFVEVLVSYIPSTMIARWAIAIVLCARALGLLT